jgi:hypothetical protein
VGRGMIRLERRKVKVIVLDIAELDAQVSGA